MRRNENVASHTAADIQELLASKPKEIMRSLDQIVAAAEQTSAENRALHIGATRRQLRGGEGECKSVVNHTNTT